MQVTLASCEMTATWLLNDMCVTAICSAPSRHIWFYCRKPDAFVELPDQSKEAVPKWLNSYVEFLWKACFDDKYLIDKLARVNHMLAPPTALFTPDVSLRLLWVWIGIQASTLQKQLKSRSVAIERL